MDLIHYRTKNIPNDCLAREFDRESRGKEHSQALNGTYRGFTPHILPKMK
jgi:hypothetical protein